MRVSVKLWEASHRQRPLTVMIAVITPPFTPAHTQSLPSTLIQSKKKFHCWKLKMTFAFLGIRWSRCLFEMFAGNMAHSPPISLKLLYLACLPHYLFPVASIPIKVVSGLKCKVPLKESKMSFCQS